MNQAGRTRTEALLEKLVEWNTKKGNEAQAQAVEALQRKVRAFRIRVPLIGKFSAGKSTLLNLLLDEDDLLEVDILPETALPTEICYSEEDHVYLYPKNSDTPCEISWEQYYNHEYKTSCGQEYQASELQKIRLALRKRELEELPDLDLVDLPGFDSGIEDHDRILDSGALGGSAYLLVFPMNDPVVKESMVHILQELILREGTVPVGVVVTKASYAPEEEWPEVLNHLRESLKRYLQREFPIFVTDRDCPESVYELRKFLKKLQNQWPELVETAYHPQAAAMANELRLYLRQRKRDLELSGGDLEEKEAKLQREIQKLNQKMQEQREVFQRAAPVCRDQILEDVERTLHSNESRYLQSMMRGRSPEEQLNTDVRTAVIQGVKTYFEPKVQEYVTQVQDSLRTAVMVVDGGGMSSAGAAVGAGIGAGVAAGSAAAFVGGSSAVASLLSSSALGTGLATALGSSVAALSIPVIGIAIGGMAALITLLVSQARKKEKRQECEQELRAKVFPSILKELRQRLDVELTHAVQQACDEIQKEVDQKTELLNKSLQEAREKRQSEENRLTQEREQAERELKEWEEICREYGY